MTTLEQNGEQTTQSPETSEEQELFFAETERDLEATQVEIQTSTNIDKIKKDIDNQSFSNYMSDNWTPLESQSPEIQNLTQTILRPAEETEASKEQKKYNELKSELVDGIKNNDIKKIASSVKKLLKEFLWSFNRMLNIWNDINYTPDEKDRNFFINAINATLDPEKRSRFTYLLWKIKDEETKQKLKEKWIENPTQFQLFLQNCKPWQLLLTNGDSTWAKRQSTFLKATQIVSWARRCHAAVISDVKEKDWIIVNATVIQANSKWINEVSLKEYVKEEYKSSDLLVWTFQPPEKWDDVVNKCRNYIWWKYSQINLVADTIWDNLHISKQKRNKYCSELVFTWMQEAGLTLPDPHTTPADLLSTNAITPEYCCYCSSF